MTCCPRRSSLFVIVLVLMAFISGCGGSEPSAPTHPTPGPGVEVPADVVNMNGTWAGTLESPEQGVQQITLTVVQFVQLCRRDMAQRLVRTREGHSVASPLRIHTRGCCRSKSDHV